MAGGVGGNGGVVVMVGSGGNGQWSGVVLNQRVPYVPRLAVLALLVWSTSHSDQATNGRAQASTRYRAFHPPPTGGQHERQ